MGFFSGRLPFFVWVIMMHSRVERVPIFFVRVESFSRDSKITKSLCTENFYFILRAYKEKHTRLTWEHHTRKCIPISRAYV